MTIVRNETRSEMTDFGGSWPIRAVDTSVNDEPPADAGSHRHIEHCAESLTGAESGFSKCRTVAVVPKDSRHIQVLLYPIHQWKSGPSVDLVTRNNPASRSINGTSETEADPLNVESLHQSLRRSPNLLQDSFGSLLGDDVVAFDCFELSIVSTADAKLQFGPANFDAENHWSILMSRSGLRC